MPQETGSADEILIDVSGLSVAIAGREGSVPILDGVSFQVRRGEVLALMGESGAGKSMSALAIMGILPPRGRIVAGSIAFEGRDLLRLSDRERRQVRGTRMAMIHQDAPTALNPVYPVGWQIAEMFRVHRGHSAAAARAAAVSLMEQVGIPNPGLRADDYPHQLSGGMRQRVMIAIAIALKPDLLIADEPTTALDVTVQAQILRLVLDLQRANAMGVLLVTHDFGVVAETAHRVAVLYAGRIVETGPTETILDRAAHPYSRALADCVPRMDGTWQQLPVIPGRAASLAEAGAGCAFAPRCSLARDLCRDRPPALRPIARDHWAACHFSAEVLSDVR